MTVSEFVFSEEGYNFLSDFYNRFNCDFAYLEPGPNDLILFTQQACYKVPQQETVTDIKQLVKESLEKGENLFLKRYKDYKVTFSKGVDY